MRTTIQIRKADERLFRRLQESHLNQSRFYSDMLCQNLDKWLKNEAIRVQEDMRKLLKEEKI